MKVNYMSHVLFFGMLMFQSGLVNSSTVTLKLENGESQHFNAVVCRTDPHQDGNLIINASVSAHGEINNQKVVLFIDQSHPVGAPGQLFEDLQIWHTDISIEDLTNKNKNNLSRNLDSELHTWYQNEQVAIQKRNAATKDMTVEQVLAMSDKASKELNDARQELLLKESKKVRSFGQSEIKNNTINFNSGPAGLEMFTKGEQGVFSDLLGIKFSANVTCHQ